MFFVHWGVLKYLILNDGGSKEYFTINVLGGEILKMGGGTLVGLLVFLAHEIQKSQVRGHITPSKRLFP